MHDNGPFTESDQVGEGLEGGLAPADVVPTLLRACLSLAQPWEEHLAHWQDEEPGIYLNAGVVAGHLVDLLDAGNLNELRAGFAAIESLLIRGDRDTRAMLIVGVIEDVQSIGLSRGRNLTEFHPFMGPETAAAWERTLRYWKGIGATSLADVVRFERGEPPSPRPPIDPTQVSSPRLRNLVETFQRPTSLAPLDQPTAFWRLLAKLGFRRQTR